MRCHRDVLLCVSAQYSGGGVGDVCLIVRVCAQSVDRLWQLHLVQKQGLEGICAWQLYAEEDVKHFRVENMSN